MFEETLSWSATTYLVLLSRRTRQEPRGPHGPRYGAGSPVAAPETAPKRRSPRPGWLPGDCPFHRRSRILAAPACSDGPCSVFKQASEITHDGKPGDCTVGSCGTARGQWILRCGRVCAGQGERISDRGACRRWQPDGPNDNAHSSAPRGISRRLPTRHHHGLPGSRMDRRTHRRISARAAIPHARSAGGYTAHGLLPDRISRLLVPAHRRW